MVIDEISLNVSIHLQRPEIVARLRVDPDLLRRRVHPAGLGFTSTEEVTPLAGTLGQPRALEAIEFGLQIRGDGHNLFATGPPGSGRTATVLDALGRSAAARPRPDDWVYVYDFDHPTRPRAIRLPAGRARRLERDMDEFIEAARREISRAFEDETYEERRRSALAELTAQREAVMREAEKFARERGYGLQATPGGILAFPVVEGRPRAPEELQQLPPGEREELERRGREVQEEVSNAFQRIRQLEREAQERVRELDRQVALFAVDPRLRDLRDAYADVPALAEHLDRVREDIPGHLPDFTGDRGDHEQPTQARQAAVHEEHLDRYRVNVLVDNADAEGAPVVVERNPTYYNLIGRVQYRAQMGAMVTDFRQVRAGALHRANGGFLVLEAPALFRQPFAWEALKRALRERAVRIENLVEQFALLPTATITPEPVELSVKVVLIGPPVVYHLLHALEEDFPELFKVKADFAPDMPWSDEHVAGYAAFVSRCVREGGLRHFDASAVARVVERGSRLREHQGKLSTRLREIADVVTEASFWAERAGRELVRAEDVDRATAARERRSNLLEERIQEQIGEGTLMIATEGARTGQVNGLSIIDLGDYRFGRPSRVTARVAVGRGQVDSIERETELSGPIHSKGVLILSGYLSEQYAQEWPLALHATITFEQSYEAVEGDSASSAELYALLSALSGLPLRQDVAVTGSVSQHGEVQPVGGINHKIEGFYRTCLARGLTGDQGVLIPAANVVHLMLNDEVVQAVREGRFHVWAVRTIDEGVELLTGRPAGVREADGGYPEGSVHRLVAGRLRSYAERFQPLAISPDGWRVE
jgi:lon-related putative ATP-dependent protease